MAKPKGFSKNKQDLSQRPPERFRPSFLKNTKRNLITTQPRSLGGHR